MKKILIALVMTSGVASADMDYACVDICLTQVDSWQFCNTQCSTPSYYEREDSHITVEWDCSYKMLKDRQPVEAIMEACRMQ